MRLTDVQMPGMTGTDLRDRLIADGYRRPIIFMSALSADDAAATASITATSRFLKKPFSDERVIDCLDRALKDLVQNTRQS
jgi:FixJ family two-component response regulator